MKIYNDIVRAKQKVINAINKYGICPDHNYYNYLYMQNANKKCTFFDFGHRKGIIALFNRKNDTWRVINGVFAPNKEKFDIFLTFLNWATSEKKSRRVFVESLEDFKSEIFKKLKNSHKCNLNYSLYWPIYNLDDFDEQLSGKRWKKLRNIRNRFQNHFKIEAKNPKRVNKNILKNILFSWTKKRYPRDRVDNTYYLNIIKNNFKGFDVIRAISLNEEICSFSGGWLIPNSDNFYYAIGIFNYKYKNVGDFINLDDLFYIKKLGYKYVDLGGSEKALLHFKKKFKPIKIYKTYFFSISPK